jgi:hypothetical protein
MTGLSFPQYPPTLPGNTVIGRLGPTAGPSEAVPIASLTGSSSGAISINLPPNSPGSALDITTSGTTAGINITQTGPNSGTIPNDINYNSIVVNDGTNVITSNNTSALSITDYLLGNMGGQKSALSVACQRVTAPTNTAHDQTAGTFQCQASVSNGGVDTSASGSKGSLWGLVPSAALLSGATNYNSAAGGEVEVGIFTGASAAFRMGWTIVATAPGQGAVADAALDVAAVAGPWQNGLFFESLYRHAGVPDPAAPPIATTGTIIAGDTGAYTVNMGIDFHTWTFTGNQWNMSNSVISKDGYAAFGTATGDATSSLTLNRASSNQISLQVGGSTRSALYSDASQTIFSVIGSMPLFFNTNNIQRLECDPVGNVIVNIGALATSATNGFLYIPTCAGTPTGVPTAFTGRVPMIYDTTANKFWIYNGAWRGVVLA